MATTTIISTVDDPQAGTALIAELVKAGLNDKDVEVLGGDHLRSETVGVDRQDVDRKLDTEEAAAAFKERTIEMIGTTEEVAVDKAARVVGEVSLNKQVSEREQKVQETVRRTHVDVEQVGAKTPKK